MLSRNDGEIGKEVRVSETGFIYILGEGENDRKGVEVAETKRRVGWIGMR